MIGRLAGRIVRKAPQAVLIDVGGVGYQVTIPLSTFYTLAGEGEAAVLEISTQVREDAIALFGFATGREKRLFEQLIAVSKIGPKLATAVLSGMPVDDLCAAIAAGDVARLSTIPGVGAKTAERMALELRGKVAPVGDESGRAAAAAAPADAQARVAEDAVAALVNLGYRPKDAEKAVARAGREGEAALAALIRRALAILSG
ncbi:MAG TPA: Holliday junction branch migration protein RuvA [Candidatus Methanoperedens sp.]|nr:Holliday junction branch migration protein RuvA [Candidatus Methanoperedens sp.]